ncbi:ribosomal protein L32 [Stagonosporopsis vannaccii]|nr:ribosomal protein L32 [Stagonosporopsis vannaccii]
MSVEIQPPLEPAASTRTLQPSNATHNCPSCGTSIAADIQGTEEAQRIIRELQAQIDMLREKAAAAADRCADYEDQIRTLKSASREINRPARNNTSDSVVTSSPDARPSTAGSAHARSQSRFSFLTGRLTSPVNSTTAPPLPAPPTKASADPDLLHELERERALRAKAEDRIRTVDSEIEELSVTLFSQANEMVAEERRARAKLEERIELLEKKDKDKMGRLDRLEKAVSRLDRVRALLNKEDAGNTLNAALPPPPPPK